MLEYSVRFVMVCGNYSSSYPCFGKTKETALRALLARVGNPFKANIIRVDDYQSNCVWVTTKRLDKHTKREWYKINKEWASV